MQPAVKRLVGRGQRAHAKALGGEDAHRSIALGFRDAQHASAASIEDAVVAT
jgi:hypothetical protein